MQYQCSIRTLMRIHSVFVEFQHAHYLSIMCSVRGLCTQEAQTVLTVRRPPAVSKFIMCSVQSNVKVTEPSALYNCRSTLSRVSQTDSVDAPQICLTFGYKVIASTVSPSVRPSATIRCVMYRGNKYDGGWRFGLRAEMVWGGSAFTANLDGPSCTVTVTGGWPLWFEVTSITV